MNNPDYSFWGLLEPVSGPAGTMVARVPFPELCDHQLAAVDSDGRRHYLISISVDAKGVSDVKSRGIIVSTEELRIKGDQGDNATTRYIDILCLDPSLYDGFDLIGHQIAESLNRGGVTECEAVSRVLSRWRYFWGTTSSSILSRSEIIGLFSELRFISHWLLPCMDVREAIASWRGPQGGRHDFEWADKSVEAKGTTSVHGRRHWIHGLDQLMPPENGKLFLYSLVIREETGAYETLPGVIENCRELLVGNLEAADLFEYLLAESGYSPLHVSQYDRLHFRIVDEALYRVEGTFPRVTENALRELSISGITEIDYEISLDGFDEYIAARKPICGIL